MKLDAEYSQGDRVAILVVSLFSLILFFRLHIFITIIPFECWGVYEIWESRSYYLSPFALYAFCLVLYFVWACLEGCIAFKLNGSLYVKIVSILTAGTVLFLLFGFFHFWPFLQIEKGFLFKEDYFWKISKSMRPPEKAESLYDIPSWKEFVVEQRCKKGLSISDMTQEEKLELHDKYWSLEEFQ